MKTKTALHISALGAFLLLAALSTSQAAWTPVGTGGSGTPSGGGALVGAIKAGLETCQSAYIGACWAYMLLYGVLLGIAIAWGQAGANTLPNFFMGSMIVIGSSFIAQIYTAVFP